MILSAMSHIESSQPRRQAEACRTFLAESHEPLGLRVKLALSQVQEEWKAQGNTDCAGSSNRKPELLNRELSAFDTDEDEQDHGRDDYVESKKRANAS